MATAVGLHGVAALYDNLGSKIGANSRRKKESCAAGFLMHFKIPAHLCLKCDFWQVKKLAILFFSWQHFCNTTGLDQVSGASWVIQACPHPKLGS